MTFFAVAYFLQSFAWGAGCYVAIRHHRRHGIEGFGALSFGTLLMGIGSIFGSYNVFQTAGITIMSVVSFTLVAGYIRLVDQAERRKGVMEQLPSIGRIIVYRSRTGAYDVPAVINCTLETLHTPGVEAGFVPDLSSESHVHLTVFTPGLPAPMTEEVAEAFQKHSSARVNGEPVPVGINQGGSYQEWDVPFCANPFHPEPGTWRWPERT